MTDAATVTLLVVAVALAFDFVNGFHDAANSVATIVATKVLKPTHAVLWASFFNFMAVFIFGTGVAQTVGSGMISLDTVTPFVVLAGLLGAVVWGLITWRLGIPASSSHALLGGYAGAAMTHSVFLNGWSAYAAPIMVSGWTWTLAFIMLAPILGLVVSYPLMKVTMDLQHESPVEDADKFFGKLQLVSSALLSLMHGGNDAQKTAGVITGALVASGKLTQFAVPDWVLWMSYGMMGFGTLVGGWRIVNTMGHQLTRLRPNGGFCAETAAASTILLATLFHLPVSTTHTTTGAILGVGAARRIGAVRWNVAGRIAWAWLLTIPAAALMGASVTAILYLFGK